MFLTFHITHADTFAFLAQEFSIEHRHYNVHSDISLTAFPLEELEETTGMPPYYVDEDYSAEINEPLTE